MNVSDLTRDQMVELKQRYLCEIADAGLYSEAFHVDRNSPSYGDVFVNADDMASDSEVSKHYAGMSFAQDDFWCSCTEYDERRTYLV